MRSVSHELVHHDQNCKGKFENIGPTEEGYAQSDPYLREMEEEAYKDMTFRDWENQKNIKEKKKMKNAYKLLQSFRQWWGTDPPKPLKKKRRKKRRAKNNK